VIREKFLRLLREKMLERECAKSLSRAS